MRSHLRIQRLLALLLIALLAATMAQAQDATVETTPEATTQAVVTDEVAEQATVESTEAATEASDGEDSDTDVSEPVAGVDNSGDISTTGLALGVLLLGLGAVALVGGLNWMRDNYKRPDENE